MHKCCRKHFKNAVNESLFLDSGLRYRSTSSLEKTLAAPDGQSAPVVDVKSVIGVPEMHMDIQILTAFKHFSQLLQFLAASQHYNHQ